MNMSGSLARPRGLARVFFFRSGHPALLLKWPLDGAGSELEGLESEQCVGLLYCCVVRGMWRGGRNQDSGHAHSRSSLHPSSNVRRVFLILLPPMRLAK